MCKHAIIPREQSFSQKTFSSIPFYEQNHLIGCPWTNETCSKKHELDFEECPAFHQTDTVCPDCLVPLWSDTIDIVCPYCGQDFLTSCT